MVHFNSYHNYITYSTNTTLFSTTYIELMHVVTTNTLSTQKLHKIIKYKISLIKIRKKKDITYYTPSRSGWSSLPSVMN